MASLFDIIMSEEDGPNIFDYSNDSMAGLEKFAGNLLGVTDILNYAGGRRLKWAIRGSIEARPMPCGISCYRLNSSGNIR